MRKIIVINFVSLDGVIQGCGGPEEDTSGGFSLGGWIAPFVDETTGAVLGEEMAQSFDLLLGRKTFDIWAPYWPTNPEFGKPFTDATKYVASNTLTSSDWQKSVFLSGDAAAEVEKLKQTEGPNLHVYGSGNLLQTLFKNDLVDELWLKTFPVILGTGKRLFEDGIHPGAWTLTDSKVSPSGVVIANYKRAGDVVTGSF